MVKAIGEVGSNTCHKLVAYSYHFGALKFDGKFQSLFNTMKESFKIYSIVWKVVVEKKNLMPLGVKWQTNTNFIIISG